MHKKVFKVNVCGNIYFIIPIKVRNSKNKEAMYKKNY